jgi:hypothetical protein
MVSGLDEGNALSFGRHCDGRHGTAGSRSKDHNIEHEPHPQSLEWNGCPLRLRFPSGVRKPRTGFMFGGKS